ncbi:hypothetical protein ACFV4P_08035 [Kitasatospora sp. NPDC059795]|uniref:hypothetical protein n=1 Tax=Kitasatospora sp. NPDC059795 TaxID=3346949 RepID=UPI0036646152
MSVDQPLSDEELAAVERRSSAASPGPWIARLESRQSIGGGSFVQLDSDPAQDDELYLRRFVGGHEVLGVDPRTDADIEFIAGARQDVPRLLAEVRRLRAAQARRQQQQSAAD